MKLKQKYNIFVNKYKWRVRAKWTKVKDFFKPLPNWKRKEHFDIIEVRKNFYIKECIDFYFWDFYQKLRKDAMLGSQVIYFRTKDEANNYKRKRLSKQNRKSVYNIRINQFKNLSLKKNK